jgi:integrase
MARVKDLWHAEVPDRDAEREPGEPMPRKKVKTARHPERGGNPDAKRYLAIWLDPDGKEKTKAFAKQTPARAYAKKMEGDAERGEYVDPKVGKGKFGGLAEKYLRLRELNASTRNRYEGIYRLHIEPVFGNRAVAAVKASDVKEWLLGPLAKLGDGMRETAYLIVAGTFDLAVADKMRHDNPARSDIITPPHVKHVMRDAWPVERVWSVRDELPEAYRALVDCAAGLGLRQGCAFALSPDDLDDDAGKVNVCRQVVRVGRQIVFKLPKGGKERTVPLPRGVAASVELHAAKFPPVAVTLPWMDEHGELGDPVTVKLLFTWQARPGKQVVGLPLQYGNFGQDVWKPALSRLGIIPPPVRGSKRAYVYKVGDAQHNGMHSLRHIYESMLDDGGVSLAGMMEFMGHSRTGQQITIGVYGHVTDETFERARNAVDARLFKLRPVTSAGTVTELRRAR